jgi:hypothetical protein
MAVGSAGYLILFLNTCTNSMMCQKRLYAPTPPRSVTIFGCSSDSKGASGPK